VRDFIMAVEVAMVFVWRHTSPCPGEPGSETQGQEQRLHPAAPLWVTGPMTKTNQTPWALAMGAVVRPGYGPATISSPRA
jgi:hypothetical protein